MYKRQGKGSPSASTVPFTRNVVFFDVLDYRVERLYCNLREGVKGFGDIVFGYKRQCDLTMEICSELFIYFFLEFSSQSSVLRFSPQGLSKVKQTSAYLTPYSPITARCTLVERKSFHACSSDVSVIKLTFQIIILSSLTISCNIPCAEVFE